jgi:hypothetical protein
LRDHGDQRRRGEHGEQLRRPRRRSVVPQEQEGDGASHDEPRGRAADEVQEPFQHIEDHVTA